MSTSPTTLSIFEGIFKERSFHRTIPFSCGIIIQPYPPLYSNSYPFPLTVLRSCSHTNGSKISLKDTWGDFTILNLQTGWVSSDYRSVIIGSLPILRLINFGCCFVRGKEIRREGDKTGISLVFSPHSYPSFSLPCQVKEEVVTSGLNPLIFSSKLNLYFNLKLNLTWSMEIRDVPTVVTTLPRRNIWTLLPRRYPRRTLFLTLYV